MKTTHLLAIGFIFACTAAAWIVLGGSVSLRTRDNGARLGETVEGNWGPQLVQTHPKFFYLAPNAARARRSIQPERSEVRVRLGYDPRSKGLLRYRTYHVDFHAVYTLTNPTPVSQTIYAAFQLPADGARYDAFSMKIGDKTTDKAPANGKIAEALHLKSGESLQVTITYQTGGLERWMYGFDGAERVKNFELAMQTDFLEINIPDGCASPTAREQSAQTSGWTLNWKYTDVLGASAVGMDMPNILNPGPVAARISFFAPVSLLFYFAVLVIVSLARAVRLHPMHYFFIAAGCFAFQLLFAYLVDLLPVHWAFGIASGVSLLLVTAYLWRVAGFGFARTAALAQAAYMVLFSYSFFFDGLTGITIAVGAVITLAILMFSTARTDWSSVAGRRPHSQALPPPPPPVPFNSGSSVATPQG
ncbi:MAG: inner membrane CreD family protein [Verrucomicrobiales bacterium]|nr:inner membrane CreD family protein [Verrucomicrobiales bacterium]